ncbi:hypothetical protein [Devosia sp.]|uniref:hypothetical protein n=1 Tax=Devosia sp. TaxID=1871048 RepID=UPI003A8DA14B
MKLLIFEAVLMAGVLSVGAAQAADLVIYPEATSDYAAEPAVSGVNGKLELDLGYLTDPESAMFRGAGSISVPVGDMFGLQGDISVENSAGDWSVGGALHAFTRDPSSYLLGITAGVVRNDNATLAAIGPEAEVYLGQLSFEGWGGWASLDYDDATPDLDGGFAIGDLAYYATDDWRVSIGGASILGENSLNLATEYQFAPELGLALSGEARWHDTGAVSAMVGLKGYLGTPGKSLIDRHRQDDPPNRALDLAAGAGDLMSAISTAPDDGPKSDADCELDEVFDEQTQTCVKYPI